MAGNDKRSADSGVQVSGRADERPQAEKHGTTGCRCKETADMTPRQLLARMMQDLAFWKREKKG